MLDLGDPARALAQAQALVQKHPAFVPGYSTLFHLLWEHGAELAPGVPPAGHFLHGLASQPDNAMLRVSYSQFLMASRQPDAALEQVRQRAGVGRLAHQLTDTGVGGLRPGRARPHGGRDEDDAEE